MTLAYGCSSVLLDFWSFEYCLFYALLSFFTVLTVFWWELLMEMMRIQLLAWMKAFCFARIYCWLLESGWNCWSLAALWLIWDADFLPSGFRDNYFLCSTYAAQLMLLWLLFLIGGFILCHLYPDLLFSLLLVAVFWWLWAASLAIYACTWRQGLILWLRAAGISSAVTDF